MLAQSVSVGGIDGRGQMLNLTGVTGGEERMRVRESAKNTGIILYLIR